MTKEISILFVDDEPNVLASLKRMMRFKSKDWTMKFANSGEEALALFDETNFDVIISDIKMPGMDGAELLSKVRELHSSTIRIALSGQVNIDEVLRSIKALHQYIPKPCTPEILVEKIQDTLMSKSILTDHNMQSLVSEIDSLPVIPSIFSSIESELGKKYPSINKIADLISMDVGLVAKLLKFINSSYFGLPTNIKSISQSISLLGIDTIRTLLLGSHLFAMYDKKKLPNFSLNLLWEHSFRVSKIASLIAQKEQLDRNIQMKARMTGLLHDVGKLVLANSFPEKYQRVLDLAAQGVKPIHMCETEVFKTSHAPVGAYLMGLWGMKGDIVDGIGRHHSHGRADLSIPMIVSIANMIDHQCVIIHKNYGRIVVNKKILKEADSTRIEGWINYVADNWDGITDFNVIDSDILELLKDEDGQ